MNLSEIQIDSKALLHNVAALRRSISEGVELAAVVKGNSYGHGLEQVVSVLEGHCDYFQVDDVEELRALRKVTRSPALVFGYVQAYDLEEALSLDAELGVFSPGQAVAVGLAAKRLGIVARVHLKVDTLLGRLGVLPAEIETMIKPLLESPNISVMAAYGHYANIEDTTDLSHATEQMEAFERVFEVLKRSWPTLGRHLSATSGAMTMERASSRNTLIRFGIGIYGMFPSGALARSHESWQLKPAMRWVSHLAQVKDLPARHPVGYGLTYICSKPTRVGIVPQGYSDGYDRGLSNSGEILVRGRRCPVIGRVAMNMFAVDLSKSPEAREGDEVVLMGGQGSDFISAEEIAARIGTIHYEVTSRISPLVPRIVV